MIRLNVAHNFITNGGLGDRFAAQDGHIPGLSADRTRSRAPAILSVGTSRNLNRLEPFFGGLLHRCSFRPRWAMLARARWGEFTNRIGFVQDELSRPKNNKKKSVLAAETWRVRRFFRASLL